VSNATPQRRTDSPTPREGRGRRRRHRRSDGSTRPRERRPTTSSCSTRDAPPAGRLATRRIGGGRFDHGAQFFTVRTDEFGEHVAQWRAAGLVVEWCRGFGDVEDGHPRYAVAGGMNALAKHLAAGLDVRCNSLVFGVHRGATRGSWEVRRDDATAVACDALVVTSPLPQSYSLLVSGDVAIPDLLWRTDYDRTLGLLAVLDRPSAVPAPGAVQGAPPFQFVADNQMKGISDVPALTLHANAEWSSAHWDDDHDTTRARADRARPRRTSATPTWSRVSSSGGDSRRRSRSGRSAAGRRRTERASCWPATRSRVRRWPNPARKVRH
jgi:predicted NAD/FAD-dependent oxidoreductase